MLADVVGQERTIGCVVGFGSTMHAPGEVEMTSAGEFIIGNWNREPDKKLEELAGILGQVVETRTIHEILPELYSKLIINSCITTLGAVCGQYLGEMLVKRKARNLFIEVIGMKYRKLKSSSLQSLERGRKTEVDNYNGYIVSKGRELGVATPVNQQLTRMVGEIEQGKRKIDPGNFNEISNIFL